MRFKELVLRTFTMTLLLVLISGTTLAVQPNGGDSNGIERPGFDPGVSYYGAGFGANVNLFSGSLIAQGVGTSVPGRNGLGISFQPSYSSASVYNDHESWSDSDLKKHGPLGLGWHGWHFGRVRYIAGTFPDSGSNDDVIVPEMGIEEPDGTFLPFIVDYHDINMDDVGDFHGISLRDGSRIIWYTGRCPDYLDVDDMSSTNLNCVTNDHGDDWRIDHTDHITGTPDNNFLEHLHKGKSKFVRIKPDGTRYFYEHFVGPGNSLDGTDQWNRYLSWWTGTNEYASGGTHEQYGVGLPRYDDWDENTGNQQLYLLGYYITRIEDKNGNYVIFKYNEPRNCKDFMNFADGSECDDLTDSISPESGDTGYVAPWAAKRELEVYTRSAHSFGSPYVDEIRIVPYACKDEGQQGICLDSGNEYNKDEVHGKEYRSLRFTYSDEDSDNIIEKGDQLEKVTFYRNCETEDTLDCAGVGREENYIKFTYSSRFGENNQFFQLEEAQIYDGETDTVLFPKTEYVYYDDYIGTDDDLKADSRKLKKIIAPQGGEFEVDYDTNNIEIQCSPGDDTCSKETPSVKSTKTKDSPTGDTYETKYYYRIDQDPDHSDTDEENHVAGKRETFVVAPNDGTGGNGDIVTKTQYFMAYNYDSGNPNHAISNYWKSGLTLQEVVWDGQFDESQFGTGVEVPLNNENVLSRTDHYWSSNYMGAGRKYKTDGTRKWYSVFKPLKHAVKTCIFDPADDTEKRCTLKEFKYWGEFDPLDTTFPYVTDEINDDTGHSYDDTTKVFRDGMYGLIKETIDYGEVGDTLTYKEYFQNPTSTLYKGCLFNSWPTGQNQCGEAYQMLGTMEVDDIDSTDNVKTKVEYLHRTPESNGKYFGYFGEQDCLKSGSTSYCKDEIFGMPEFLAVTFPVKTTMYDYQDNILTESTVEYDELHYTGETFEDTVDDEMWRRYDHEPKPRFQGFELGASHAVPNLNPTTVTSIVYDEDHNKITGDERLVKNKYEESTTGFTELSDSNNWGELTGVGNLLKKRSSDRIDSPQDSNFADNYGVSAIAYDDSRFFVEETFSFVDGPSEDSNGVQNGYTAIPRKKLYSKATNDPVTGKVVKITDSNENFARFWYDELGRIKATGDYPRCPEYKACPRGLEDVDVKYNYNDGDNDEWFVEQITIRNDDKDEDISSILVVDQDCSITGNYYDSTGDIESALTTAGYTFTTIEYDASDCNDEAQVGGLGIINLRNYDLIIYSTGEISTKHFGWEGYGNNYDVDFHEYLRLYNGNLWVFNPREGSMEILDNNYELDITEYSGSGSFPTSVSGVTGTVFNGKTYSSLTKPTGYGITSTKYFTNSETCDGPFCPPEHVLKSDSSTKTHQILWADDVTRFDSGAGELWVDYHRIALTTFEPLSTMSSASDKTDYINNMINWFETANPEAEPNEYNSVKHFYDGLGRLERKEMDDPDSACKLVTTVSYDSEGKKYEETIKPYKECTGSETTDKTRYAEYDALGRVKELIPNTAYALDKVETIVTEDTSTVVDPKGSKTKSFIDGMGRTEKTQVLTSTNTVLAETTFGYNELNQKISVKDGNSILPGGASKTTLYEYNSIGEMLEMTSPDKGTVENEYDKAGRLIKQTLDDGRSILTLYDSLSRPVKVQYQISGVLDTTYLKEITYDGWDVSIDKNHEYDDEDCNLRGRIAEEVIIDGTDEIYTKFCYDYKGRLDYMERHISGKPFITRFHYDKSGKLIREIYPDNNRIEYKYDDVGRLKKIEENDNVVADYEHNPSGTVDTVTFGNGVETEYTYNPKELVESVVTSKGSDVIYERGYFYDKTNNLETLQGPGQADLATFVYDELGRLKDVNDNGYYGKSFHYTYDTVGNRKTVQINTETAESYLYEGPSSTKVIPEAGISNKLIETDDYIYDYDEIGNMKTRELKGGLGSDLETFSYDLSNNLKSIKYGSSDDSSRYWYDSSGKRVVKKEHILSRNVDDIQAMTVGKGDNIIVAALDGSSTDIYNCDRTGVNCKESNLVDITLGVVDLYYSSETDSLAILFDDGDVNMYTACSAGWCYFNQNDDGTGIAISGESLIAESNEIINPGFEVNTYQIAHYKDQSGGDQYTGETNIWSGTSLTEQTGTAYVARDTTDGRGTSTVSMEVHDDSGTSSGDSVALTYVTSASPLQEYTCSGFAKIESRTNNPSSTGIDDDNYQDIWMVFYDSNKEMISDFTEPVTSCDGTVCETADHTQSQTDFYRYHVTRTSPTGTAYVGCFALSQEEDESEYLWDDMMIEEGTLSGFQGPQSKLFIMRRVGASQTVTIARYDMFANTKEKQVSITETIFSSTPPTDLDVAPYGDVIVAGGTGADKIYKYDFDADDTDPGGPTITEITVTNPVAVSADKYGNIYYVDDDGTTGQNDNAKKIDSSGNVLSYMDDVLEAPFVIDASSSGIFVADLKGTGRVLKFADPLSFDPLYTYYFGNKGGNYLYEEKRKTNTDTSTPHFVTFKVHDSNACDKPGGCVGDTELVFSYCSGTSSGCIGLDNVCYDADDVLHIDGNSKGLGICEDISGTAAWSDCDKSSNTCGTCAGSPQFVSALVGCSDSTCWSDWKDDETTGGEFTSFGQTACCGDDENEYYVSDDSETYFGCCSNPNEKLVWDDTDQRYECGIVSGGNGGGGQGGSPLVMKAPPQYTMCNHMADDPNEICLWTGSECVCVDP